MVGILLELAAGAAIALELDRRVEQLLHHTETSDQAAGKGASEKGYDNATGKIDQSPRKFGRGEAGKSSSDANGRDPGNSSALRALQDRGRYW
jgi:hypothetical protein